MRLPEDLMATLLEEWMESLDFTLPLLLAILNRRQLRASCPTCTFSPLIVIMHVSYSCHVFRVRLLLHLLCRAHPVLGTYGCLPPSVISADACLWYLTAGNIWQGLKLADWQCCEHANKLIITLSYHYVGVVSFGMNQ